MYFEPKNNSLWNIIYNAIQLDATQDKLLSSIREAKVRANDDE